MAIWSGNPESRISIWFTSEEHELVALASYVMDFWSLDRTLNSRKGQFFGLTIPLRTRDAPNQFWSYNSCSSGHWVISDTFRFEDWNFFDTWLLNDWLIALWVGPGVKIINMICIGTLPIAMVLLLCSPRMVTLLDECNALHPLDISTHLSWYYGSSQWHI